MNIFYTQVDKNLQTELNARGATGFQDRTNKSLNFMLGKIANVQITAYVGNSAKSGIVQNPLAVLGGAQVQGGRYLPNGDDGFLTEKTIVNESIDFYTEQTILTTGQFDPTAKIGNAYLAPNVFSDRNKRIGPYITGIDIAIGDHSMGLLNKATINIVIPNLDRDLDNIEEVWFRPGRYVSIEIVHPDSVIVSKQDTQGLLTPKTLPNKERIKQLYPDWDVDEFLKEISQLNTYRFEGLITSFEFSYTADGTVEATLSLTGTSNVYTDVSMYLPGTTKNEKNSTPTTNTENFKIQPIIKTTPSVTGEASQITKKELYELIYDRIDTIKKKFQDSSESTAKFTEFLLPFTLNDNNIPATDHFLLTGQQYLPKIDPLQVPEAKNEYKYTGAIKRKLIQISDFYVKAKLDQTLNLGPRAIALSITPTALRVRILKTMFTSVTDADTDLTIFTNLVNTFKSNGLLTTVEFDTFNNDLDRAQQELEEQQVVVEKKNVDRTKFIENFNKNEAVSNYNRYITLGALIHVINTYIVSNVTGSAQVAKIIHTDALNFSNYYPSLVSTNPEEILFLPKNPNVLNDMNGYGNSNTGEGLVYYKTIVEQINKYGVTPAVLQKAGWKPWPGVYEKSGASAKLYPSRIFINLETIQKIFESFSKQKNTFTVKAFIQNISNIVSRCSGNAIDLKLVTHPDDYTKLILTDTKYLKSTNEPVIPYSIPMFANHPYGSIVREFSFSAKLPDSVKNLSYVLNQGDDVTEEQIAPYMNFMYNSKNPALINKTIQQYKNKYTDIIEQLQFAKINYGLSPGIIQRKQALYKAITDYIKYPSGDIKTSQQITAPIFPFEVEFTIDGINGLRYGDVLTFEALPYKYRINTVFSVIGITHTVSNDGEWTTKIRCIMRPSID